MGKKRPRAGAKNLRAAKKPAVGAKPKKQLKRPYQGKPLDADNPTVVWGFGLLDLDGEWGWGNLSGAQAKAVLLKCQHWERQTQTEFFKGGKKGNKRIPLENLSPKAQGRLRKIERDDLDELWEIHVSGLQRIWGTRLGHVFYLLWWDPEHTVCPSTKTRN